MDITSTTAPRSDQQNFDDYIAGPKTVTVVDVKAGTSEQPVEIHLAEFPGRPYKPSKTQRRVLVAAWGAESSEYVGRRMTLRGDPSIKFGGIAVGGIVISHLSHIDKPLTLALTVKRGSRAPYVVDPLPTATAPEPDVDVQEWVDTFSAATSLAQLAAAWDDAIKSGVATNPVVVAAKDEKKVELI